MKKTIIELKHNKKIIKVKNMILKIIWSEVDKAEEVMEISNYYTENDYLEVAIGKNKTSLDREIIVNEGEVWINVKPDAEHGEDYWDEVVILTDAGIELFKTTNLDIEQIKQEQKEGVKIE